MWKPEGREGVEVGLAVELEGGVAAGREILTGSRQEQWSRLEIWWRARAGKRGGCRKDVGIRVGLGGGA